MFTTLTQTHLCRNVFFFFLLCTLIFSSSAASRKDSEIGESLKSSTGAMSRPPNCISRCEKCTPCKPILVVTPPTATHHQTHSASLRPHEYYPLAWKCTCGGKYYDP